MKRVLSILAVVLVGAWSPSGLRTSLAAPNAASAQAGASADLASGTAIDATLSTSVDAKKNKAGDRVEARTAQDIKQDGKLIMKKGTRLTGHVTEVQPRTKDQTQSELGIVFDHASIKNGDEMPLTLTIQALAPAQVSPSQYATSDDGLASGGGFGDTPAPVGGALGDNSPTLGGASAGAASTAPAAGVPQLPNAGAHSAGAVGGLTPSGRLAPNSSGVFGMEGLSLRTLAGSGATDGSVILSPTKNVHLDSGTQMILSVAGSAQ